MTRSRSFLSAGSWLGALFFISAGCAHRAASPLDTLREAQARLTQGSGSARDSALAAFYVLLAGNDAVKAKELFEQSLQADAAEPYALAGQWLLAQRNTEPHKAVLAALDVCENAPRHPLAAAAARVVFESAGLSLSTDALIAARGERALNAGLRADAAVLMRSALASVFQNRHESEKHQQMLSQLGTLTTLTLTGPFSPYRRLAFDTLLPMEKTGTLPADTETGPYGSLAPRVLRFDEGRFSLAAEPLGDVYLGATDLEVPVEADYVVRTVTGMDHAAILDGTPLFRRETSTHPASTLTAAVVRLPAGTHRLLFKLIREEQASAFYASIARVDGQPSGLTFKAAHGAAPQWNGVTVSPAADQGFYSAAADFAAALTDETGEGLAAFLAAYDGLSRDHDGAKRLWHSLPADAQNSAAYHLLGTLVTAQDRTVPAKVATGRASRELEVTLEKDPHTLQALALSATLALEDARLADALEWVKRAKQASGPLWQLRARIELALGSEAQADLSAQEAEKAWPGLCESLQLRYDLAKRYDAIESKNKLVATLASCPGALMREAEHDKSSGNVSAAIPLWERAVATDDVQTQVSVALAQAFVSQKKYDAAIKVLRDQLSHWPRHLTSMKLLAEVQLQARKDDDATATQQLALSIDGSDLSLRRNMVRRLTGKELLEEHAISTQEALKAYQAAPGAEDAPSAYILDAAAVQAFPDGSMVDRIHIIQKALDQSGVAEVAEVNLPPGAQILSLRTLKADGSVLEPENFEGKDTISLPGVQVGDFIEYEYLLAHPSRGAAQPGFTAPSFYFQIARQPNNWSTYKVIAPKGAGMSVDARRVDVQPVRTEGNNEVFFHEERRVAPFVPEPSGPPSGNEWLPYVTVGAGALGNEGVVNAYADLTLDNGQATFEVEQFAQSAAKGKTGREAVEALYSAVMEKLSGPDVGLSMSAAASVAQDRGSRLWLLKSSLMALGFDARLVAVRTFQADPQPYRFPNEQSLPYICLRVVLPQETLWLDTLVRFAPFAELPEVALGNREAYVLPEPGKGLEKVTTPPMTPRPGRDTRLTLALSEDGTLSGEGKETYEGYAAAALGEALESLPVDQREQALQGALARYFGGAEMEKLDLDVQRKVGGKVTVAYRFKVPRFAREEGPHRKVLRAISFPNWLGKRYLTLSERRTPLFIDGTEHTTTKVELTLPAGWSLSGDKVNLDTTVPFGRYSRKENQQGNVVTIEETLVVKMARIEPKSYLAFGDFAGSVDLIQERDLLIEKR
ncbi:MAG: hypothetical protein K1X64_11170 [Myxococcaceae bacterium]|nr:hypothetical protein [Myxococcaceae bacterium]